jgi:hypothetical protein
MSAELPHALQEAWDGTRATALVGQTAVLVTVEGSGSPHVALLSAGEVAVTAPDTVHFALWPASRTTANLESGREALLLMVHAGGLCKIALRPRRLADLELASGTRACLRGDVVRVSDDRVGYASVTAPISFALDDPAGTVERWTATLSALREAAATGAAAPEQPA